MIGTLSDQLALEREGKIKSTGDVLALFGLKLVTPDGERFREEDKPILCLANHYWMALQAIHEPEKWRSVLFPEVEKKGQKK